MAHGRGQRRHHCHRELRRSPAAPETQRGEALRWGDDYQLLFTASATPPVPATRIGTVIARGEAPLMLDGVAMGDPALLGWQHAS
jgi:thiamine-monophosphate kinase